jgi:hypothetical protein
MPSKKQRARVKKSNVETRKPIKIYKELLKMDFDMKTIMMTYMGHQNIFEDKTFNTLSDDNKKKWIEVEMEPVDKELLDKIKLFIDDSQILLDMIVKKPSVRDIWKEICSQRCQLVYVWANMDCLYRRQEQVNKILSRLN